MSDIISTGDESRTAGQSATTSHSQTSHINWEAIEQDDRFRDLLHKKRNFIVPATIIFIVYYFGFLILVGYAPSLVDVDVIGHINIAYLFALSQFVLAWVIVYLYVRRANVFDKLADAIVAKVKRNR